MENISKIFYTDEVEPHALSGVLQENCKGEYVSIAGPSGSGKSIIVIRNAVDASSFAATNLYLKLFL